MTTLEPITRASIAIVLLKQGKTLEQIGEDWGLTRQRMCQIASVHPDYKATLKAARRRRVESKPCGDCGAGLLWNERHVFRGGILCGECRLKRLCGCGCGKPIAKNGSRWASLKCNERGTVQRYQSDEEYRLHIRKLITNSPSYKAKRKGLYTWHLVEGKRVKVYKEREDGEQ